MGKATGVSPDDPGANLFMHAGSDIQIHLKSKLNPRNHVIVLFACQRACYNTSVWCVYTQVVIFFNEFLEFKEAFGSLRRLRTT